MTASQSFSAQPSTHRPVIDVMIEGAARGLLSWSARRAAKNQLSDERMALILETQRTAPRGGSALGR